MADINVNVVLPNPISVDVTSPTQALATNVSIPGPQGPAGIQGPSGALGPSGAKGAPTTINSLSGENIIIIGADGNIVSTNGIATIYISGNSGYFQSAINSLTTNLILTGANLNTSILSLSGLFTGHTGSLDNDYATDAQLQSTGSNLYTLLTNFSGNLDANYASDLQLFNTGSTLDNKINSLSGWSASAINLQQTGENLYSLLINFSGNLDANYASDAQLFTTGSTLDTKINSLSGYVDIQDNSILLNLNSTGSILDNRINSLSGYSASIVSLASTGSTLDLKINSLSGYSASINNLQSTGSNLYSMLIGFSGNLDATYATDSQLATTGSNLDNKINSLSGYSASAINLASTGSNLYTLITNFSGNLDADFASQAEINSLSGYVNLQDISISNNLTSTGSTLDNKINSLSGSSASAVNLTSTGATLITNLFNTGSNLNTKIDNLSGYVNAQDNSISNNLISTGSTLNNKINSLSGAAVLKFDDQIIYGTKYFNENVYIHNLYVTGDEFIANVTNSYIESPYLLLNLTGGAIDGGIFFVTGSGFTGINDYGPIIGFDHSNKFKIGVARRSDDLSFLPDIASVQQIEAYSGVANNTFSTITNLALTGSTLNNKINSLSGWSASAANLYTTGSTLDLKINSLSGWSASAVNLASTGSTLDNKINSLSGWSASSVNLASTGSTLDSKINSLSGWSASAANLASTGSTLDLKINSLSGWSASAANLASTGSNLNNRINNLSGYINSSSSNIVFTTGNQTISGIKSFAQDTTFGDSAQGDFLVISGNNFTVYGSGNFTSGLFVNSNSVLTGIDLSSYLTSSTASSTYSTITNLALTGSTLVGSITSLSGLFTGYTGALDATFASDTQLYTTGSTLDSKINSLSGNLTSTYATITNLATTGSTLDTKINNLSGYVNSSGSNIVFTTGNQIINGLKTFTSGIDIYSGASPQILRIFNSTGTNSGEFALIGWRNNQFVIGSQQSQNGILRDVVITGNNININGSGALNIFDNTNIVGNLTISGNTTITGHLSAASKSFLIDHPTIIGKKLQYGSLEGPEHGVFVRGKTNENIINLPNYWPALVDENSISVNLTPISAANNIYVIDYNNSRIITNGNNGNYYFYTVYGERKDIPKLTVEF